MGLDIGVSCVEDRGLSEQQDHAVCGGYIDHNEDAMKHLDHTEVGGIGTEGFLLPVTEGIGSTVLRMKA